MKRRRGRRGFWWWSWLLVLAIAGGVGGGYVYGERRWEEAPKEFIAAAQVSFKVRDPFISRKVGVDIPTSEVADANEMAVLRQVQSEEVLSEVVAALDLAGKWGMEAAEAIGRLRILLEFDLDQETDELKVLVRLNDPVEAAATANAVAGMIPEIIQDLDEVQKENAFQLLEAEAQPVLDREAEARNSLQRALETNGINIKLVPGVDLGPYRYIQEVLTTQVAWDSAQDDVKDLLSDQAEYRTYWQKSLTPSILIAKAEPPALPVGPDVKPFQVRWSTYGLTAGLILGSLLMLACWKLFP